MASTNSTACIPIAATSNGAWQGDNPINFALPLLILQICLVLAITRALAFLLRPLRQPRVIAEIIGGVLLGPTAFGKSTGYLDAVFPGQSLTVLDTLADLGLIFFLFLVGLELDLNAIRRTGKQALAIAAAGITVPFVGGVGVSIVLKKTLIEEGNFGPFLVFMGVAMSITAFPVLARILAERKLLTTDVGQMAMSAAAVNDVVAWILLALAVALSGSNTSPLVAIWVLLCGLAFVAFMFVAIRPLLGKLAAQVVENESVDETYVAIILAGLLTASFVTDAIGIHSIFGAFVFGLIIPKDGPFASLLIEKIEDLVTILMLPLYFVSSGLKTNIRSIHGARACGLLVLVIAVACAGKICGTVVVALLNKMNFRKSLALGFLMNTKGLVELIVLNIGKDRKVLNDEIFAIMVIMALFTTFITTPIVMALYKPARNPVPYNRRKLYLASNDMQQSRGEAELRILAGVHGLPNVHAIINLVEAARGTRKQPLLMYILHMLELSERPSAIMKVQRARRNGYPFWDNDHRHTMDHVVVAFESYGQLSKVTVRPMTVISHFDDMHEDICATAADKRAAIIILPFHKHARSDSFWEGHAPGFRNVNQKVLIHAPCSVGILIDRGIGMTSELSSSFVDQNVVVLFYGGPDDREALALGCRMAEHPGVKLTVYRFVLAENTFGPDDAYLTGSASSVQLQNGHGGGDRLHKGFSLSSKHSTTFDFMTANDLDWVAENKLDDECLGLVKAIALAGLPENDTMPPAMVVYNEKTVVDPVDGALEIERMHKINLIIVGRSRRPSPMIAPLAVRHAQFPELGPIGDALVTSSMPVSADLDEGSVAGTEVRIWPSILVVQQHDPSLTQELNAPYSGKAVDVSSSMQTKVKGLLSHSVVVISEAPQVMQAAAHHAARP